MISVTGLYLESDLLRQHQHRWKIERKKNERTSFTPSRDLQAIQTTQLLAERVDGFTL